MSDIITIKGAIKGILEAVVSNDSTSKLYVVYNYPENKPSGYPYAWIDYKGDEAVVLNNREDRVSYEFDLNIVQEKIEDFKGREEAEETTEERSYAVNSAFRADNNLGLSDVLRTMPIKTVKEYVEGATRIKLTITLKVETRENVI